MKPFFQSAFAGTALLLAGCSTAPDQAASPQSTNSHEAGRKGRYFVEVAFILKDGRVTDAKVLRTDAPEALQKAALDAVRKFRTKPGHSGLTSRMIYCDVE